MINTETNLHIKHNTVLSSRSIVKVDNVFHSYDVTFVTPNRSVLTHHISDDGVIYTNSLIIINGHREYDNIYQCSISTFKSGYVMYLTLFKDDISNIYIEILTSDNGVTWNTNQRLTCDDVCVTDISDLIVLETGESEYIAWFTLDNGDGAHIYSAISSDGYNFSNTARVMMGVEYDAVYLCNVIKHDDKYTIYYNTNYDYEFKGSVGWLLNRGTSNYLKDMSYEHHFIRFVDMCDGVTFITTGAKLDFKTYKLGPQTANNMLYNI